MRFQFRRIPRRAAFAIAGVALLAAGTTVVASGGSQVQVVPPTGSGYQVPPAAYDVSGGPVTVTFSYDATNLTTTSITTDVEFDVNGIGSVELAGTWTDVSSGYPALTETQLADAVANHEIGGLTFLPKSYQSVTLPPGTPVTVTSTVVLSECGYYQLDSASVNNEVSGLFATGFVRVIGCTTPTPTPTPTPTSTPTPTATPTPNTVGMTTTPDPHSPVPVGTTVHDTATLSGETADAGGVIHYYLYTGTPANGSCGTLVADLTPTDNAVVDGVVPNSVGYTFDSPGTWYFVAVYSGDAHNAGISGGCGDEPLTVVSTSTPTPTPTGGVGAATTSPTPGVPTPGTGAALPSGELWIGLALLGGGAALLLGALVVGRRPRPV